MATLKNNLDMGVARLEKGRGGKVFIDVRKEWIKSSFSLGMFLGVHREELGLKRTNHRILGSVFVKMEEENFLAFDDEWDTCLVTGEEEVDKHLSEGFAYHFYDEMHRYVNDPYFMAFTKEMKEEVYSDIKVHEEVERLLLNTRIRADRLVSDTGAKGFKITFS